MRNTRSTHSPARSWIGLLAGVQVVTIIALWGGGPSATPVQAQGIPDAGAQRERMIELQKATNDRLDRLITLLSDGKLEVTLRKTDDAGRNR